MDRYSDLLNKYRVFPRLFAVLFGYILWIVVNWFMELSPSTAEQAAFASTIVATSAAFFKFYVNSGGGSKKIDE